ncbi:MAG: hypothetical protein AAGA18_04205 [Verrucomicrobiota bacterium]
MSRLLILCPSHMTRPLGGPKGILGDRIHQLAALQSITSINPNPLIWPHDNITKDLFSSISVEFIEGNQSDLRVALSREDIFAVIGLFFPTQNCRKSLISDCHHLIELENMVNETVKAKFHLAQDIHPRGETPHYIQLIKLASRILKKELPDISLPLVKSPLNPTPSKSHGILLSPLSGSPKHAISKPWWQSFAKLTEHQTNLLIPILPQERENTQRIFEDFDHITIVEASLLETVAIASEGMPTIGIDGGRLNLLAAGRTLEQKVVGIYGDWPASAWALPNIIPKTQSLKPEEALELLLFC